ncbi:MAG: hypothetical protein M1829_002416 [Trizodia sp. TS-e1964]|nr:MAG: hypothetical protein M1829_002416 [Trizodia sp. TS-e1964]
MIPVNNLPLNLGTITAFIYSTLYILMEPVAGGMVTPLLIGGAAIANYLTTKYGAAALHWAISAHIFSWIAQFVGHGIFEGRAPALLDNLVQALFLAPFFVWMEVLFFCGYRPELKGRLSGAVDREIRKLKESKETKNGPGGS